MATAKTPRGGLSLVVRDADLDKKTIEAVSAARRGDQVLGFGDAVVADLLPKAVLRRLTKMIPSEDFSISEITLKFTLSGELLGVKVGGDASVKVIPRKMPP